MLGIKRADIVGLLAGVFVVLVDQFTKAMVSSALPLHHSVEVIPGFFSLTYVRNTGAAFGILASISRGWGSWLLLGFSVGAMILFAWLWIKDRRMPLWRGVSLGLILGGACGNLLDRARLGEVVDFLDFYIGQYHWPAFNVADSAITVGTALFALSLIRSRKSLWD